MRHLSLSVPLICAVMASPIIAVAAPATSANPSEKPASVTKKPAGVTSSKSGANTNEPQPRKARSPWTIEIEGGLGYDSNAYLAPSNSYVDYAPATTPTVNPKTHSGVFLPIAVDVDYSGRGDARYGFVGSYSFRGNLYPDSGTSNANENNNRIVAGMDMLLKNKGRRDDTLRVTSFFGTHDKNYFNRDTGEDMVSNAGTNLSQRYSYSTYGLAAKLSRETTMLPHNVRAEWGRRDYVEPLSTAFDSYDYDYLSLGGDVEFRIARPSKLVLSYDYSTRDYDEWRARDRAGRLVRGTARKYVYNKYGASLYNKLNRHWSMYLDYDVVNRDDDYVGYGDYTQTGYGVRVIHDDGDKLRVKTKAKWWDRNYSNAFAFDEPTQPDLTYDRRELSVRADYALRKLHGPWVEYKRVDQESTDSRYEYERYQLMVGWYWKK